jgi:hypothetical protein
MSNNTDEGPKREKPLIGLQLSKSIYKNSVFKIGTVSHCQPTLLYNTQKNVNYIRSPRS